MNQELQADKQEPDVTLKLNLSQEQGKALDVPLATVSQQVGADLDLAKQAIVLANGGHKLDLLVLALKNKGLLETEVKEIEALVPVIKSEWKSPELYLILIFITINVCFFIKGQPLPWGDDLTLGGMITTFIGGRHVIKNTQEKNNVVNTQ